MGTTFLLTQIAEYARVGFAPEDNAFATIFYCLTGLHGAHVFVGLTLLLFATIRAFRGHYSPEHHHGVELAGHLLALRRRDVDRRLHDGLHHLIRARLPTDHRLASGCQEVAHGRRNPFRTEAEAFRLLFVTIAAFAAIAVASLVGGWKLGVSRLVVVTVAAIWYYLRPLPEETRAQAPARVSGGDERRLLVVANETVAGRELHDAVGAAVAGHRAQVLVVCPALNSQAPPLGLGRGRRARRCPGAARREPLRGSRRRASMREGEVGDSDPLQAIEDALRTFGADEIIISTHPEGRSNWLERGVVESARAAIRRSDHARRRRPRRLKRRGPPKRPSIGWQRMTEATSRSGRQASMPWWTPRTHTRCGGCTPHNAARRPAPHRTGC